MQNRFVLLALCVAWSLTDCGYKGPLYLPPAHKTSQATTQTNSVHQSESAIVTQAAESTVAARTQESTN